MKIKTILALGAGLSAAAAPGLAAAARPGFEPQAQESRIGVELDWLNTEGVTHQTNLVSWDLTAQIGVTDRVFIDADIPWVYVDYELLPARTYFGNPWVGVHYARSLSENVSFWAGGALGLPVDASPDTTGFGSLAVATTMRAYSDRGRFATHTLPTYGRFGLELDYAPLFMRFEINPELLLPLRGGPDTALVIDHAFEIGGRGRSGFLGGARLQGNLILTDAPDHVQFAIEPFFGYEANGPGLFLRLGYLIALDDDLGFGFDPGKVRTWRFAIGGKF